jgi:hypothetical protein
MNIIKEINEIFEGEAERYNPFKNNNYAIAVYNYSLNNSDEETTKYFNITRRMLSVIKNLDMHQPELLISAVVSGDNLAELGIPVHSTFGTREYDKPIYKYKLLQTCHIPMEDYNEIIEQANIQSSSQKPFYGILYELTQYQKAKVKDFTVNYSRDALLLNQKLLRYFKQICVTSVLPEIYYHFYKDSNNIIQVTRLYKEFSTYQAFEIK